MTVVIETPKSIHPRLDIKALAKEGGKHFRQFSLLVLSMRAIYDRKEDDPKSYYQIAGIHGLPYVPYDGVTRSKDKVAQGMEVKWGGYCHHGSVLFPTWHRPYLLLLEMELRNEAKRIVEQEWQLKSNDLKPDHAKWIQAAEEVRCPYWSWDIDPEIPLVLLEDNIDIWIPKDKNIPTRSSLIPLDFPDNALHKKVRLENPFKAFSVPADVGRPMNSGDCSNPTARPRYQPPLHNSTPYTPKGFPSIRRPTAEYTSNSKEFQEVVRIYYQKNWIRQLKVMYETSDYDLFSNHSARPKEQKVEVQNMSIETIHDSVHDAIGGNGGHMSYPDIAGFDPIFFLHHCNIDRIFAIWQDMHPDSWIQDTIEDDGTIMIEPGRTVNAETPLYPFRKSDSAFFNSNDVRKIGDLGYTYDYEVKPLSIRPKITEDLFHKRVIVNFPKISKFLIGGPFEIRVFVDMVNANASTPIGDDHFAGSIFVFARPKDTPCEQCLHNVFVRGQVDITSKVTEYANVQEIEKDLKIVIVSVAGGEFSDKVVELKPIIQYFQDQNTIIDEIEYTYKD